jgi:hypothetical protein
VFPRANGERVGRAGPPPASDHGGWLSRQAEGVPSDDSDVPRNVAVDHRWAVLARTLRSLGMWEHLSEDEASAAELLAAEGKLSILTDENPGRRGFFVDGEEMAEAGATERLFTLTAGGDDGIAWLVDPRIVAAIGESGLVNEAALPVLAAYE